MTEGEGSKEFEVPKKSRLKRILGAFGLARFKDSASSEYPLVELTEKEPVIKLTVNVVESLYNGMLAIVEREGSTMTAEVKTAFATHIFIDEKRREGKRFFVKQSGHASQEVVWKTVYPVDTEVFFEGIDEFRREADNGNDTPDNLAR